MSISVIEPPTPAAVKPVTVLNRQPAHSAHPARRLAGRLLLLSPLALLWLGLEVALRVWPGDFARKHQQFAAGQARWQTLILGSSHTYCGLNPRFLGPDAYNLAYSSQPLYYDYELLRHYLPTLPRLRRVILPLSYPSLAGNPAELEYWQKTTYLYQRYAQVDYPTLRSPFSVYNYSLVAFYTPTGSLDRLREQWAADGSQGVRQASTGWMRQAPLPYPLANADLALTRHHAIMRTTTIDPTEAKLDSMATLLRARGIDLVLLTTPVMPAYAAGARPAYLARNQAAAQRLVRRYGARYYDFWRDPRFQPGDFYDADHLNARGAARLSRLLADTLAQR